jgi:hypothetical protein
VAAAFDVQQPFAAVHAPEAAETYRHGNGGYRLYPPAVAKGWGAGVVSTHPSLGGVCDGRRSQAAASSAETMAPKGPRELASGRCDVGPFECWSPGARQEGRQVPFVSRAKAVTTTYSSVPKQDFGVVTPPPVASTAASEMGTAVPPSLPEVVPVWQAVLDLRVWRSRPWWLRAAASLVVKRLNR